MKKLTLALLLVAAFCLVAVAPVAADASTNPANSGLNSTSPFWIKDTTPLSGKTYAAVFAMPTLTYSGGKNLTSILALAKTTPLGGKTYDGVLAMATTKPLGGKTYAAVLTVPAFGSVKTSQGGYPYIPA